MAVEAHPLEGMNLMKKNIAANFAGSFWQALMALAFIPLYIKFMGIEAYGLIGIFASLQAMFSLLDMGLSATLNREMARLSILPDKAQEMRDISRSMEVIYWSIAAVIAVAIAALAPFISHYWVKPGQLSPDAIEQALVIMGLAMALQWPVSLYSGGLMGLQRQVLLNVINIGIGTFRGLGAVMVLWLISPTIYAFFVWQIVVSATNVFLAAFFLWRSLPPGRCKTTVQGKLLRGSWRFAAGMSGITILATILTQTDKIILSKMLTLDVFGYYTLASMVAMTLYRLIVPVLGGVYPRFTQLVSLNDKVGLNELYHKSCQFMSVLILPATVVVVFFSYELLLLWTQNPVTTENAHLLVSILIIGTALNGLMNLPYALQLAHGWTKLALYMNLISVIVLTPLMIFMTSEYGAVGGAIVWVILNSGYILIAIHFMHRRLLPTEKWFWYGQDIGIPLIVSVATAGAGRLLMHGPMTQTMTCIFIFIISTITLSMTILATPKVRALFRNQFIKLKVSYGN